MQSLSRLENDSLLKSVFCGERRFYSANDTGILGEKELRVLLMGAEPDTFISVLRTVYHCIIGDVSWQAGQFNCHTAKIGMSICNTSAQ